MKSIVTVAILVSLIFATPEHHLENPHTEIHTVKIEEVER